MNLLTHIHRFYLHLAILYNENRAISLELDGRQRESDACWARSRELKYKRAALK